MNKDDFVYWVFTFWSLPTIYCLFSIYFKRFPYEHTRTKSGTALNVFFTYQMTNTIAVIYLGIMGIILYIYQEYQNISIINPPIYLHSNRLVYTLIYPMMVYQFYSIVLYLLAPMPELGGTVMLLHHIATLTLGLFSVYPRPYLQGYSIFFFGIVELSTIPLQGVDLYKHIRYTKQFNPIFQSRFQIFFAVSFLSLRVGLWPIISVHFWRNAVDLLLNSAAHSPAIVIFSLCANLYLSLLQFYWGAIIIRKLCRLINNTDNNRIFLCNFTDIKTVIVATFQFQSPERLKYHMNISQKYDLVDDNIETKTEL